MCDTNITGGKLRRHITRVHKNREDVKHHMKETKLDNNFFAEQRVEGIKKFNIEILSRKSFDNAKLMRGRESRKAGDEKMCTGCNIHSKRYFL